MWCHGTSTGRGVHQPASALSGDLGPGIAGYQEKKLLQFRSNKKNKEPYYKYSEAAPRPSCRKFGLTASGKSLPLSGIQRSLFPQLPRHVLNSPSCRGFFSARTTFCSSSLCLPTALAHLGKDSRLHTLSSLTPTITFVEILRRENLIGLTWVRC